MIVGVGIDVVATPRWARALDKIKEQVFTPRELADRWRPFRSRCIRHSGSHVVLQ